MPGADASAPYRLAVLRPINMMVTNPKASVFDSEAEHIAFLEALDDLCAASAHKMKEFALVQPNPQLV